MPWLPSPSTGDGTITQLDSLASGQTGLCWVAPAGSLFFTGNTGCQLDEWVPNERQRSTDPARGDTNRPWNG